MSEEKGKRKAAEERVAELTEGLKETMVLFTEREESFDSLARINKEQERKVGVDSKEKEMRTLSNVLSLQLHKLEQRAASLQNAQFLRCKYCQKVPEYLKVLREKLAAIFNEQQRGIQEMSKLK